MTQFKIECPKMRLDGSMGFLEETVEASGFKNAIRKLSKLNRSLLPRKATIVILVTNLTTNTLKLYHVDVNKRGTIKEIKQLRGS